MISYQQRKQRRLLLLGVEKMDTLCRAMAVALLSANGCASTAGYRLSAAEPASSTIQTTRAVEPNIETLDALAAEIRNGQFGNTHALLVAHRGMLKYEAYFTGDDRIFGEGTERGWEDGWIRGVTFGPERLHDARSITKTVVATLVGIAIDEGYIPSAETSLVELLPRYQQLLEGRKRELRLKHLLSMTPGLEWSEANPNDDEGRMYASPDAVAFVLQRKLVAEPGKVFEYGGGTTHLLGAILEARTGKPIEDYAREKLFGPLGIERFEWRGDIGGMPAAASGLRLLPRDFIKLGLLFENEGRWEGKQIVSSQWLRQAMQPQAEAPLAPGAPVWAIRGGYGFQMWYDEYRTRLGPIQISTAVGLGGQRIFVVPKQDLVVVILSGHYRKPGTTWTPEQLFHRVVEALGYEPGTSVTD